MDFQQRLLSFVDGEGHGTWGTKQEEQPTTPEETVSSSETPNGSDEPSAEPAKAVVSITQSCEWNLQTDDLRRIERRYHELPRDSCSFCLMKAAGSGRVNDEARVTSSPSLVDTFTQYKVVRTPWSFLPLW